MNKHWRLFLSSYTFPSGKWLFSALLGLTFLPFLLKTVFMLIRQASLPAWLIFAAQSAGWLTAWFLLFIAMRSLLQQPSEKFWYGFWRMTRTGGLWLLAMTVVLNALNTLYLSKGGLMAVRGNAGWFLLGAILIILIVSFLLAVTTWNLAVSLLDPHHQIRLRTMLAYWLLRPFLSLGTTLAIGLAIFALPLAEDRILAWLPWHQISFLWVMTDTILQALFVWLILQPIHVILNHHAAVLTEKALTAVAPPPPASSLIVRLTSPLVALLLIIAAIVSNLATGQPLSSINLVKSDIEYNLSTADMLETAGDFAGAAYYSNIAEARILAWQETVLAESGALKRAQELAPGDEQVQLLSALQSSNKRQVLERGLFVGQHSPAWHLALLDAYHNEVGQNGQLNGKQKQIRAELLRLCILQENFSQSIVLPQDLANSKPALSKILTEFTAELANFKHCALAARQGSEGGINRQLVLDTLAVAETYPEKIKLQQLAMLYGSAFLEDKATHYERTAAAALRFDQLFEKQKSADLSKDSIVAQKLSVAKALMDCNQLETCAQFLSELTISHPVLDKMSANCLYLLEDYEQCLAATRRLLESEPQDPRSLYLAAFCTLKLKDMTSSLGYAIRLAELIESEKDPLPAESLLYPWLLRFTLRESNVGYVHAAYENLDEPQKLLLASNTLLNDYALAMHLWTRNDPASRALALEQLTKVLALRPDLSRAIYIQGALYYELKDNEKALACLKASLSLDAGQPTAWYALATLYDRMESYPESYAACQKVLEYLPSTDHAKDLFGVSIHAKWLMEKLEPLLEEVD
jgi:tetratricopeptide (TPR) repeat protein